VGDRPVSPQRAKTLRLLLLVEAGLFVAAAIWGLTFQLTINGTDIPEADYQAVAQVLARDAQPGDVVLLYPWWTERARLYLPEGTPVVGYLGSDTDDLSEHPRIWLLAAPDLPKSDLPGFLRGFQRSRAPLAIDGQTGAKRFGKLSLALYRNDRARPVLWSAVDNLDHARVYLEHPDGQHETCRFAGGLFRCPHNLTVGAGWHELFYQPRRCLFMHAPGGPDRLVAEFDDVPAAPTLRVSAGIVWEHAWKHGKGLTPYDVTVGEPGQTVLGRLRVPVGREGLLQEDLAFGKGADGSPARTVSVSVQSDRFEERDGCVELTALGGGS